MKCSLCGKEFKGDGNNPAPFKRSKCCDECNSKVVIPLRMALNKGFPKSAVVFKEGGSITIKKIETPQITLKEAQDLVGGYIEVYPINDEKFIYLVDEEGLIKNRPLNKTALEILGIEVYGNLVLCPQEMFD